MRSTLLCKRMSHFSLLNIRKTDVGAIIQKLIKAVNVLYARDIDTYDGLKLRTGRLVRFQKKWSGPYWRVSVVIRPYGHCSGLDDSGDCHILCIGHVERMHFIRFLITHRKLD